MIVCSGFGFGLVLFGEMRENAGRMIEANVVGLTGENEKAGGDGDLVIDGLFVCGAGVDPGIIEIIKKFAEIVTCEIFVVSRRSFAFARLAAIVENFR